MRETSIIPVTDERNVSLLKSLKLMVLNCIRFLFVKSFLLLWRIQEARNLLLLVCFRVGCFVWRDDKHGNFTIFVSSFSTHSKCWWTQQQAGWLADWLTDTMTHHIAPSVLAKSSRHFMGKIKLNKNLKLPTWIKIVL